MEKKILIIDDDKNIRELYEEVLSDKYEVFSASDGVTGIQVFARELPDVVLLDIRMPGGMTGLEVLPRIREIRPESHIFMITAVKDTRTAIEAMQKGAYDYLIKPVDVEELQIQIERVFDKIRLEREVITLRETIEEKYALNKIIGESSPMQGVFHLVEKVKDNDSSVLICGESGTGKELVARAIHFNGHRKSKPFIAVNAAAIPDTLIESELFGHEKGAFTGAAARRIGKFEQADGGTLFLDEIGNLKQDLQAKLLRVLQEREIERVGGTKPIPVNLRLICATSVDIEEAVRKGEFRQDLFFRINVIPITLPPLRRRVEDIPALVGHFVEKFKRRFGYTVRGVDGEGLAILQEYGWPGNVRELEHLVERLFVVFGAEREIFTRRDVDALLTRRENLVASQGVYLPLGRTLAEAELEYIRATFENLGGDQAAAAETLAITRKTLRAKLRSMGLVNDPGDGKGGGE